MWHNTRGNTGQGGSPGKFPTFSSQNSAGPRMLSRGCLIVGSVRQLRSRAAVGVVPVGGLTTPGGNPYSQLFSTAAVSATGDRGVATPRVYLLNSYRPPPVSLCEALRALRAYSFAELPETVELSLKCNMTLKKVSGR